MIRASNLYDDSYKLRYRGAPIAIYENQTSADTKPHIHSEVEILYIEKGRTKIKVSEEQFTAAAGELVFINPLEVHSITVCTDSEYLQAYWLTNADKAYKTVKTLAKLKNGNLDITALVEDGMFEESIMFIVALYSEMLWDVNCDLKDMINQVALRDYIDFA